jgi:hypothetical protein
VSEPGGESSGWRRLGTKQGAAFDEGVERANSIIERTQHVHRVFVVIGLIVSTAIIGGVVWLLIALF